MEGICPDVISFDAFLCIAKTSISFIVTNEWYEIQIGLVYVIDRNEKTLIVNLKQILSHDLNFHSREVELQHFYVISRKWYDTYCCIVLINTFHTYSFGCNV